MLRTEAAVDVSALGQAEDAHRLARVVVDCNGDIHFFASAGAGNFHVRFGNFEAGARSRRLKNAGDHVFQE